MNTSMAKKNLWVLVGMVSVFALFYGAWAARKYSFSKESLRQLMDFSAMAVTAASQSRDPELEESPRARSVPL